VHLKNTGDCVQSREESIGTPLDPPVFWLDNIFKGTDRPNYIGLGVVHSLGKPMVSAYLAIDFTIYILSL
jgi:hypothetical protein